MSLFDWLRGYGRAAAEAGRLEAAAAVDDGRARPGEDRFVAIEDMSPEEAAVAAAQQQPRRAQQQSGAWGTFAANRDPASFPWPTDSSGQLEPLQRGATSLVPGVDLETNTKEV